MSVLSHRHALLIDGFGVSAWPARLLLVVGGSLLLWLSAKVHVPFYPVPMTFQSMVAIMIGMAFGPRLGAATVLLYLAEGAVGMPVFSGTPERGIGLAYMSGPTGGYLLGFVLAAFGTGLLAQHGFGRTILSTALAMAVGIMLIYLPGLLWLGVLFGWDSAILELGLWPFLTADLAKLLLAACLMPGIWALARRFR
ncbi:MAG: biotin transporter BioY [Alphaproteobacteria bacterium]